MSIEVKSEEFPRYIRLEYQEFDVKTFFEEILPFIRTPHRCYKIDSDAKTLQILVGVTHPIEFKVTADEKALKEVEQKLRLNGFKKAKWEFK